MFLAIREMRHSKARYSLIMVIMLLVSFLVLFVTGLAKGLAYANISAVENMPANHFVIQDDAEHTFRRSMLTDSELKQVQSVAGQENAAALALQMSTVTANQTDMKSDVTFFAVDMEGLLAPRIVEGDGINNSSQGSVIVDRSLEDSGITVGSTLVDQASGLSFKVAGMTEDSSYSHTPVVYINRSDWQHMKLGGNPSSENQPASFNVIALQATSQQIAEITDKVDNVEVISQKEAISSIPGYSSEQGSLLMMIVFLFVIAAFVLAVFFYVITIQKTSQFGILKAMGTKMTYLASSVVGQVLMLSVASLAVSLLMIYGVNLALPSTMPFHLESQTLLTTSILFVGMAVLGSLVSVIRVARVDALEAIGRTGA